MLPTRSKEKGTLVVGLPAKRPLLDKDAQEPLFSQVGRSINSLLESGDYQAGQRIPTEPELAEFYDVSRVTIRRAIDELVQHGVLVKRQGKGTFVRERRMSRKIEHVSSFTESCLASGMVPTARLLARRLVSTLPANIANRPEFGDQRILYIQRLHLANGAPVMIENNYYPMPRFSFLLDEPLDGSLFEVLAEHGIVATSSENSYIDAVAATVPQAEHLDILAGDPTFTFYTEMLDQDGSLIYVGCQYIAAARYRFSHPGR